MKYRAEIDGLRALAIMAVVLFHAGFEEFKGGFVGVDIFLVISGYLITTTLISDMETGTFSLIRFYERRARRILPVLFLVMTVTLVGAWFWLPPPNMVDFSRSLVASSFFVSNISFWLESGYWGAANELKPLLHTWTLGLDAQFYLTFPLLLMALNRLGKRWIPAVLLGLGGISLLVSQWAAYHVPSANFFLLPTRLWEILVGAGVGYFLWQSKPHTSTNSDSSNSLRRLGGDGLAIVGFVLVIFSILSFDEKIPVPSLFSLFPVLGTALILIFASPHNLMGYFLGSRPMVGMGMMSYSLYLWHHPLLSFSRHISLTEPSLGLRMALVMLSLPLAYLSWKFVEQPFRNLPKNPLNNTLRLRRRTLFLLWLMGTMLLTQIGIAGYATDGFANRFKEPIALVQMSGMGQIGRLGKLPTQAMAEQVKLNAPTAIPAPAIVQENYGLSVTCDTSFTLSPDCRTSDAPEILVWGDSFAMQLVPGILASQPEVRLIQMTKSACGPFFDAAPIVEPAYPASWSRQCLAFTEQLRTWLKKNKTIRYAVLASPFSQYLMEGAKLMLRDGEHYPASATLAMEEFQKTLTELQSLGITPVLFAPPPAADWDLGRCLTRAEWLGIDLEKCNFRRREIVPVRTAAYAFLEYFSQHYRVIWLNKLICDQAQCKTHLGSVPLYRDAQHLTQAGASLLGQQHNFYRLITED